jgi:urease accessory protein
MTPTAPHCLQPLLAGKRCIAAGAALMPLAAAAHDGAASHAFMAGLAHPFGGLDHLAAMLAVGFWSALAARRGSRDLWLAPAVFLALLLAGALIGAAGVQLPALEPMIASSLLMFGLLVATRAALPMPATIALSGCFALYHGAAHGEVLGGLALTGMLLGSALLHGFGLLTGRALRDGSRWWTRAAGCVLGGFGALLLLA